MWTMQSPRTALLGVTRPYDETLQSDSHTRPGNIYIDGHARVHVGDNLSVPQSDDALRKLLKSLAFPQMFARLQQISTSQPATCEWLLKPPTESRRRWDYFHTWLTNVDQCPVYWIYGKPGSGKSTVLKFIDQDPRVMRYLSTANNNSQIIKLRHYFWKGGNELQKSFAGLCRVLLTQILKNVPHTADYMLNVTEAVSHEAGITEWTVRTLADLLLSSINNLRDEYTIFLLIDGLDECDGLNDQELVTDFLHDLMSTSNVKLCVSSRPDNIFKDTFNKAPQLRLEDLTQTDIELYINQKLRRSPRWSTLAVLEEDDARALVSDIIERAQGVFLWVVLVVRDLLRGLSDGDTIHDMRMSLKGLPVDLNDYFYAILQSIQPSYRREASVLLQLALFEEDQYDSVFTLHLVDTLFISEMSSSFVLSPSFDLHSLPLDNKDVIRSKLDVAHRRLTSRCKGLLECNSSQTYLGGSRTSGYTGWLRRVLTINVSFLHRSLKDFLLLPDIQALLYSFTGGKSIDARQYLINARVVQLLAIHDLQSNRQHEDEEQRVEFDENLGNLAVGLASHVLSASAVNGRSRSTSQICSIIKPAVELLAEQFNDVSCDYWYINDALEVWDEEGSDFLTLAIDFDLSSYVQDNILITHAQHKSGRPVLSYILEPRFGPRITVYDSDQLRSIRLPSRIPGRLDAQLAMLLSTLSKGADPNVLYSTGGLSMWSKYLCDSACRIRKNIRDWDDDLEDQNFVHGILSALIQAHARPIMEIMPAFDPDRVVWNGLKIDLRSYGTANPFLHFVEAWEDAFPIDIFLFNDKAIVCKVSSLLRHLSCFFQTDLQPLVRQLQIREPELELTEWGHLDKVAQYLMFTESADNSYKCNNQSENSI